MLVSRRPWAVALLAAVEARNISTGELPLSAVRALTESKDDFIRQRAAQTIGRVRPVNADKQKLIAQKKQLVLNGEADLRAGHELAKTTCLNCHKLNGEGADVGPDLTGVGRANLDALLANVIDPNQVIGIGYENVMIETKDDRSLSGRLVEDTPTHVKLLSAGPKEEVVAKSDIASLRVSEFSVMPEGLEQMPDADFRNLISYLLNATPPSVK
jgi:putative heme-binding domain-containing protein